MPNKTLQNIISWHFKRMSKVIDKQIIKLRALPSSFYLCNLATGNGDNLIKSLLSYDTKYISVFEHKDVKSFYYICE